VIVRTSALTVGTYTVAWKALSAVDGHVSKGSFAFGVGMPAGESNVAETFGVAPPSPLRLVIRWLSFLAAMVLMGSLFFRLLIWRTTVIPTGYSRSVFWVSVLLFTAGSVSDFVLYAVGVGEAPFWQVATQGTLIQLLLGTRYGWLWLIRFALVWLIAALFVWKPLGTPLLATLAALVLLSLALAGHSAAVQSLPLFAVLADWVHLLAASVWVGGLIQWVGWWPALRRLEDAQRTLLLAELAPRFYSWAFFSAAVLLLTGFHLTSRHIPNLETVWSTTYGQAFMVKHLLLLALVGLAAINLLWIGPSFTKTPQEGRLSLWKGFRRLMSLEALLAAGIVFFAGTLTLVPPPAASQEPRSASSHVQPLELAQQVGDIMIHLTMSSDRVGENEFDVFVMHATGEPVTDAERVELEFAFLERDLGISRAVAPSRGDGHYVIRGNFLSLVGRWGITVRVRPLDQQSDLTAAFEVRMIDHAQTTSLRSVQSAQIEAGRVLYLKSCAACHGESGRGDGPASTGLGLKPADLVLHRVHHSDEDLMRIIKGGKGPPMPAFVDQLSDEQIRQIILYIRTLK